MRDVRSASCTVSHYYRKALATAPNHRSYLTNEASAFLMLGRYPEAVQSYEKLLIHHPNVLLARLEPGHSTSATIARLAE